MLRFFSAKQAYKLSLYTYYRRETGREQIACFTRKGEPGAEISMIDRLHDLFYSVASGFVRST